MAPRRGRGRGKMRARPPQVIRNSIAELGNYDADVKAALQQNLDAARAYFPPLSKGARAVVTPPLASEQKLLHFHTALRHKMLASPAAIQLPAEARPSALRSQMQRLCRFYRTRSADDHHGVVHHSLWDLDACWIVPDVLPLELLPNSMTSSTRPRKRAKTAVLEPPDTDLTPQQFLQNFQQQESERQRNEADANQLADDDQQEFDPAAQEQQDDDEDVDHIADYQTGIHFDDDDGYEEVESGDDAEPVVAF
ncbi:unnamed protein product [Agarophyton chilense]